MWSIKSPISSFTRREIFRRTYAVRKAKKKVDPVAETKTKSVFEVPVEEEPPSPLFFTKTIGPPLSKWARILEKHPELKSLKKKDIINSTDMLKNLNYTVEDIISKPMILYTNSLTIDNRFSVLHESGFKVVTISLLSKYITVMNKTISLLKAHGFIPFDLNVFNHLKDSFTDIELNITENQSKLNEDMEMKIVRQEMLNNYVRQRLGMTDAEVQKMWKVYGRVRHRSFKSVQAIVNLLLEELNFPKERIIKNAYLLYGDADNVRRILKEIGTIDGQDVREIMYRRPKIMMTQCESLKKTMEHVKAFGISEDAVMRCLEVLTLGPDTILERLRDLNEIEEFQVLGTNPRILRLVHYQNKARLRLEYLNQLKVRCASLHILSCGSEMFAKFARDGTDRTKGRDIVVFLANLLNKNETTIRNTLARHPNWCHMPVLHLKQSYDYLVSKKFSDDDIFNNIHLLLYPVNRIKEKLSNLQDSLNDLNISVDINVITDSEMLTLVLYLIELEFHFTGDGVWTEQHAHQVENFNNLLPDFPEGLNKTYKYGVKPAKSADKIALQSG